MIQPFPARSFYQSGFSLSSMIQRLYPGIRIFGMPAYILSRLVIEKGVNLEYDIFDRKNIWYSSASPKGLRTVGSGETAQFSKERNYEKPAEQETRFSPGPGSPAASAVGASLRLRQQ